MKLFSEGMQNALGRKGLILQKNSPHILFGIGVVGFGVTVVTACKATLKLDETLEKGQKEVARIKGAEVEGYSEQDRQRDLVVIYTKTSIDIVKLYGPSVLFGVASITALAKSHDILNKRNAALTAAYAAVDRAFSQYRERVVTRYGEDIDLELRHGVETIEETNEKTGKTKSIKRVSRAEPSMYARFFDNGSTSWSKDPEVNSIFIRAQQRYANDLLIARGHVFLNDVYDMLGIKRSTAGSVVGWLHDPNGEGDNYIDFGLFRDDENVRAFMNGHEGAVLLDFNVDGTIFDKIETPKEALSWQRD